jgi:TolA-binding protein
MFRVDQIKHPQSATGVFCFFIKEIAWGNEMNNKRLSQKIGGIFFALLVLACLIGDASAQIIDDIILNKSRDGNVRAIIKLSGPVRYLRHFPDKKGSYLEIYFNIIDSGSGKDPWQGYEARTSPPSDLISGFVVSVRDVATQPKMVVEFNSPAEFSVSIGKDSRSFVLSIKPDKIKASAGKIPTAKEMEAQKIEVITPPVEAKPSLKVDLVELPVIKPAEPEAVASVKETLSSVIEAASGVAVSSDAALLEQSRETDKQAEALMIKGRDALKVNQYGVAIEEFNKILSFPTNSYTQDAQEWVGVAREGAGQKFKAKLEYETYLKAYSTGESVARVKERLAKLTSVQQTVRVAERVQNLKVNKEFKTVVNGSVSMNYYIGNSLTNVSGDPNPAASITDQKMLITNINASLRTRNDRYDNRLVFQDTYNKNYLLSTSQTSPNRLGSIYYDFKDNVTSLSSRLGRQSPTGGGVMGRFDGVAAGYSLSSKWQAKTSFGQLSDYTTGSKPTFLSMGLELGNNTRWGGGVYYVNQRVDGITDRSSLGGEVRYFDDRKNAFSMIDYDTYFKVLNTAMLQGSIMTTSGINYNFTFDHRRTPSMSLSNAMLGSSATLHDVMNIPNVDPRTPGVPANHHYYQDSTGAWLFDDALTKDQLKEEALKRTATSNSASLGVTKQLKENWQAGADISVSRTSGLPGYGGLYSWDGTTVVATQSTGNSYGLNARLIGNSVFTARDVTAFSFGYTSSSSSKGENLSVSNHRGLSDKLTMDSTLRFIWQNSTAQGGDSKQMTISPSIRMGYQAKRDFSFDFEGGVDLTSNTAAAQSSRTTRKYISLGGRKDF